RAGGAGGFDLWVAPALGGGRFGPPEPLPPPVNSAGDELDPAPAPAGTGIVFVRRTADGRGARLYHADRDGTAPAVPVFDEPLDPRVRTVPRIDREPAFAPDGVVLWFVREVLGEPKQVL